jgi:5-methylcytosine-specific restriction protein A
MKFTEKTRDIIRERAKHRCEVCIMPITSGGQIHHRRPRGMGGTKNTVSRSAANGLYVHSSCHAWIEGNRSEALEKGFLVHQWDDPTKVPVRFGQEHRLLLDDGGFVLLQDQDNHEYQTKSRSELGPSDSEDRLFSQSV